MADLGLLALGRGGEGRGGGLHGDDNARTRFDCLFSYVERSVNVNCLGMKF